MLTFPILIQKNSDYFGSQVRNKLRIVLTMAFNQSWEVPWSPMEEVYFIRFIRMSKQPEPLKGRMSGGCHFLGYHIPWISAQRVSKDPHSASSEPVMIVHVLIWFVSGAENMPFYSTMQ